MTYGIGRQIVRPTVEPSNSYVNGRGFPQQIEQNLQPAQSKVNDPPGQRCSHPSPPPWLEDPGVQALSYNDPDQLIDQHKEQALTVPAMLWY